MSAQGAADAVKDAVQTVTDKVKELTTAEGQQQGGTVASSILDEETGEYVSKSEFKKRQKQREKTKKREADAANKQPPPASKKKHAAEEEEDVDPRLYFENRCKTIKGEIDAGPYPYPHKFHVTYDLKKFHGEFGQLKKGEEVKDKIIQVAVRNMGVRKSGDNLRFYLVEDNGVELQLMATNLNNTSEVPFADQHDKLRSGDIIGVIGYPGRTNPKREDNPGELSIFVQEVIRLSPCLRNIPKAHYGFKDKEERYRNRTLDFIMNKSSRRAVLARHQITSYIRNYLNTNGFIEAATPILQMAAGGATARPFFTHHNEYNMELALRIATELPLKMLIMGGFDRVYELGRIFRNEGADLTHNPEFDTCEFYEAFADYNDLMDRTEDMVEGLVKQMNNGSTETVWHDQDGKEYRVNWAKPWKRVDLITTLEEKCGEKFPPGEEFESQEFEDFLKRILEKTGVACSPPQTTSRMVDKLVGHFIETECVNPTFITNHPKIMSPLAKSHRSRPGLTERFEAFVCTYEIANAYTELNDPFDQRLRFAEQAKQKAQGDDEAQVLDEGFLRAMEYGMPPTAGWGMGIDRMVMFLTDNYSIKEVLPFPFMKPENINQGPVQGLKAAEVADVEPAPVEGIAHK
ncbi:lysyl-tRNA synthetase [Polychaeton citri CBS 116435]|uniref:Probable lysine--tRNA ligase, cytoplasmic n=1 Tax=Polychaeton citri CBS 116435 TaxID=1314669 RepID=A0A9P4PZ16_9PEZI|nr:lysyl-tRNA synthetase [Polychaeton citri CBS 116435]